MMTTMTTMTGMSEATMIAIKMAGMTTAGMRGATGIVVATTMMMAAMTTAKSGGMRLPQRQRGW